MLLNAHCMELWTLPQLFKRCSKNIAMGLKGTVMLVKEVGGTLHDRPFDPGCKKNKKIQGRIIYLKNRNFKSELMI